MEFIAHRINTIGELKLLDTKYGVEIDLRDNLDGEIYISHNPFENGELFEDYLKFYNHGTMILNIKSERIEHEVILLLEKYNIQKYFFLDSSFPMIKLLSDNGERNIAIRYSEFEGLDTIINMSGKVDWVWVDGFNSFSLSEKDYLKIKSLGYKLCLVSPELQGHDEKIKEYKKNMQQKNIVFDAICTKEYNISRWI